MIERTPPKGKSQMGKQNKSGTQAAASKPAGKTTGKVGPPAGSAPTRSNAARQAAAVEGAQPGSQAASDKQQQQQQQQQPQEDQQQQQDQQQDLPGSSAGSDQQQQQQQQQEQEQAEGEIPSRYARELAAAQAELCLAKQQAAAAEQQAAKLQAALDTAVAGWHATHAKLNGDLLVMSEEVAKLTAAVQEQQQQQQQSRRSSSQGPALSELTSQLQTLAEQMQRCEEQVAAAAPAAATAQQLVQSLGLSEDGAIDELSLAISKGTQAYIEQKQLREEHQQLQKRLAQLESKDNSYDTVLGSLRAQVVQLQEQVGAEQCQAECVVWAPADMSPDRIKGEVSAAAGVSSNVIVSVERRFVPRAARSDSSSDSGRGEGGSGSSGAGASRRGQRQPNALYIVRLCSSRHLPTVLGGRTRLRLRQQQIPIWLDAALTEEERALRKRLADTVRMLRNKGDKVRWRGARLEVLEVRAAGRKAWQQLSEEAAKQRAGVPLAPPGSAGGD